MPPLYGIVILSPSFRLLHLALSEAFRSSRDFRAWRERGEGDGEEVFTDQGLRERLADPLGCFESPVPSSASDALPAALEVLGERAKELGLPKQLLRLLGEERLKEMPVVHFEGESYELWELNEGSDIASEEDFGRFQGGFRSKLAYFVAI